MPCQNYLFLKYAVFFKQSSSLFCLFSQHFYNQNNIIISNVHQKIHTKMLRCMQKLCIHEGEFGITLTVPKFIICHTEY